MGRDLNRHFFQRGPADSQWAHKKHAPHRSSSGRCTSKLQWDTVSHLLERLSSERTQWRAWRGCEETGTLTYCWWDYTLVRPLWTTAWRVLVQLKLEPPQDTVIPFLEIYIYIYWEKQNITSKRYMHSNVHSSTVYKSQDKNDLSVH